VFVEIVISWFMVFIEIVNVTKSERCDENFRRNPYLLSIVQNRQNLVVKIMLKEPG
jgi:hypothetical protein